MEESKKGPEQEAEVKGMIERWLIATHNITPTNSMGVV